MTTSPPPSAPEPSDAGQSPTPPKPARRSSERMIQGVLILAVLFFVGVALYTIFPEESPFRGLGITAVSMGVVWAMFKFA